MSGGGDGATRRLGRGREVVLVEVEAEEDVGGEEVGLARGLAVAAVAGRDRAVRREGDQGYAGVEGLGEGWAVVDGGRAGGGHGGRWAARRECHAEGDVRRGTLVGCDRNADARVVVQRDDEGRIPRTGRDHRVAQPVLCEGLDQNGRHPMRCRPHPRKGTTFLPARLSRPPPDLPAPAPAKIRSAHRPTDGNTRQPRRRPPSARTGPRQ